MKDRLRAARLPIAATAAVVFFVLWLWDVGSPGYNPTKFGNLAEWVAAVGTIGAIVYAGRQLRLDRDAIASETRDRRAARFADAASAARSLGLYLECEIRTRGLTRDDEEDFRLCVVFLRFPSSAEGAWIRDARVVVPEQPVPLYEVSLHDGSGQYSVNRDAQVELPLELNVGQAVFRLAGGNHRAGFARAAPRADLPPDLLRNCRFEWTDDLGFRWSTGLEGSEVEPVE